MVLSSPVGQVRDELLHLLPSCFPQSLGSAKFGCIRFHQSGIEIVLADDLAEPVSDLKTANEIAELALKNYILPDLPFGAGDEVVVLVSGLGATPVMELYIAFSKAYDLLQEAQI